MFFIDNTGKTEMVYGSKPYSAFENVVLSLYPTVEKYDYDKSYEAVFSKYNTLTAKEFSELTGMARSESEPFLNKLTANETLEKLTTKNGSIWKMKNTGR